MTKQSENGSEVIAPQANISASEGGVPSEVKTPENKSSEGSPKAMELVLAIIGIIKSVIDLLKKGSKDSEAYTQIQASNQNIPPEILQNIIKKTADIFANANANPEKNLTGAEESKDQVKELKSKILKSLGLDSKKMGVEGDKEFQEALKRFIEIQKPVDKENGAIKAPATKGGEEGVKDLNVGKEVGVEENKALAKNLKSEKVIGAREDKKEPELKQTSHVERLQAQRLQAQSQSQGSNNNGGATR